MNIKTITSVACAVALGAVYAEEAAEQAELEQEETPIVSASFSLAFDSKYLSYGFVDNAEPILTPSAEITFFDWFTLGASAIFDTTSYGRCAEYTSRKFQATEFHPTANIGHEFSSDDVEWLPTTVGFSVGYDYEYHARVCT